MVYKHFVVHPDVATVPALAVCAAAEQDRFAEFEHLIWEKGFKERDLSPEKMATLAKEAKLDLAAFDASMKGPACARRIQQDQDELHKVGVNGTPAFFINGRYLSGAQQLGVFQKLIDEELAKAEAAIAGGTPVADYYRVAVLDKGLKEMVVPKPAARPEAKPAP